MIKELDLTSQEVIYWIEALMYEHFTEVSSRNKNLLVIRWDLYQTLQEQGDFIALGAFEEGVLIGYTGVALLEPMHYKGSRVAVSDTIFVSKEFRNSSYGLKLIKEAEIMAREKGATEINWYAKEASSLDKIFRKKKYLVRDIIFNKEL